MYASLLQAAIQYALPAILAFVEAHQKANNGAMPTPSQVLASTSELQILSQGAAWLDANPIPKPS